MNFESDETDNDENILFDNDSSTDDSEHIKNHKNVSIEKQKQSSKSNSSYNFSNYLEIYERIYKFYCQDEHKQWQSLFTDIIQQSSTPYQTLYMFLDHTISTTNSKKHKMVLPFIEQFKQITLLDKNIELDDTIKYNILLKICRRCIFSQLESIIDIFDLRAIENQTLATNFINEQIEQHQDTTFIAHMTKILRLLESDAIPLEKIIIPLVLKSQWETIKFIVEDNKLFQRKLLQTVDGLISTDKLFARRLLAQYSINLNGNYIDVHILKRAARKLLKQYNLDLNDFPNLAMHEKLSFLKTLFVRKYLEAKRGDDHNNDEDDVQSWNEQIKELINDNHDLKIKLIDLFIDYTDIDSGYEWARFYNLEDFEIPEQIRIRRKEILNGATITRSMCLKPSIWSTKQLTDETYKPTILLSDIIYVELDSDVDPFLNRFECARCSVGSHLPFVGFDCETFMDPTQRTLNSQIVSTLQLASLLPSSNEYLYGIFDMLALRLQFDMKSLAELAQRMFCSRDFILLTYNYACDTSSLIENYPSMNDALIQGTAVIDLFRVQQYILENCPQIFPYYDALLNSKSRGLSELVRLCFGNPLDKSMQTSDWRKRPLKQAQLIYSVLDARVLVDVALLIEKRAHNLNIPWSWPNFKGYVWTSKAFKKRLGTASYVLAFDLTTNQQLLQKKILVDSIVHGFETRQITKENDDSSYVIVVFGQRTFSIIQWSSIFPSLLTTIIPQIQCPSWIVSALIVDLDPLIQSFTVLFGTALNQIYRYNNSLELIQSFKYTTLYSSCLFRHMNGSIIFAAGTVFGELILYQQDSNDHFHEKSTISDHNGAIFSITYHDNLLCTVGDDRTVKLYRFHDNLELLASFFAHEARIWQSCLTSKHILTCGEDSSIRLWSHKSTGEILRCFSVHRCKSAWCMDILRDNNDNKPLIIISGWSDGGVRRYHPDDVPIDSVENILLNQIAVNDYPRNVIFLNSLTMIVQTNGGQLLKVDNQNVTSFYDGRNSLKNGYAKMCVASDGNQYIAIGSLDGFVFIFDQNGIIINQFQIDSNKNNKVLQILWLNNTLSSKLLVCVPDGIMFIYNITNQPATVDHCLEGLPDFEQRWPNTCLHLDKYNLLLIGDRQGNILSYDLNHRLNCLIYQRFERLHGINGTSSIDIDENTNLIRSCGRDGYINIFSINAEERKLLHQSTFTITSDITWLDRFINFPSLITCFTTNNFSLYTLDDQTKRRLMHVECGGGHRNHDFFIGKNLDAYFVYIRNKKVFLARKNLTRILNEETCLSKIPPTHGTEIRCVKLFQSNNRVYMTTGSEDTQIKLFTFQVGKSNPQCEHISTLQSHLSAVCDIVVIDNFFFSCGARAQIFSWQMKSNIVVRSGYFMLHPLRRRHGGGGGGNINDENKKDNSDDDHGLDVRFTSIAAISMAENGNYLLFVTASDALLRIFRYTISTNRFTLLRTSSHSAYCQLRVKVYSTRHIAFVSSTDGLLCAYDFSSLENTIPSTSVKVHQSGINDFGLIEINENNSLRLASVGDDGSVHVSIFDINNWSWKREYSKDNCHQSPATGIRFINSTMFVSIGIDQRLKLWTIKNDEQVLELTKNHLVDIRDILSMDMIFCDETNEFIIVVAGAGVQTIQFDLKNCLFYS
ncbi:unnamed protein product [Rotaria magnacalcarata]